MILPSAPELRRCAEEREVARLVVPDLLFQVIDAAHRAPAIACLRVGQLIRPLALGGCGVRLEDGHRRRIDVVARGQVVIAETEDVSLRPLAQPRLCAKRAEYAFAAIETALVDRDIEGVAREQAVIVRRRTVTIALRPFQLADNFHRAGPPCEAAAQNTGAHFAEGLSVRLVAEIAGIAGMQATNAEADRVADRPGNDRAPGGPPVPAAAVDGPLQRRARVTFPVIGGVCSLHQHRTARSVAPETVTLRAAQDFHPLHVQAIEHGACIHADVDPVHEHPDSRLYRRDGAVHPQPADREVAHPPKCADGIERDVGCGIAKAGEVAESAGVQCFFVHNGHAAGVILQGRVALPVALDDDSRARPAILHADQHRLLVLRRHRHSRHRRQRHAASGQHTRIHEFLPWSARPLNGLAGLATPVSIAPLAARLYRPCHAPAPRAAQGFARRGVIVFASP